MAIVNWSTQYPTGLDTETQMEDLVDNEDYPQASVFHSLRDAIIQLETQVGSNLSEAGSLIRKEANAINSATTQVVCNAATAPSAGQLLTATSSTAAKWQSLDSRCLPQITYVSAGAYDIAPVSGHPSTFRWTLSDGKQRTFTSVLHWAFANGVADLGLDTGAEAASTWYYLYLVPNSADDNLLTVVASVTNPDTGPTGRSYFKYIGAIRNDGSSNLREAFHRGNTFIFALPTEPAALQVDRTALVDPGVSLSISDVVPYTVGSAHLHCVVQHANDSAGNDIALEIFAYGNIDTTTVSPNNSSSANHRIWTGQANYSVCNSTPLVPVVSSTIGYRIYRTGGSIVPLLWKVTLRGYIDKYLAE